MPHAAGAKAAIARKVKTAREAAKRSASDEKERSLHERMQRVSERRDCVRVCCVVRCGECVVRIQS